ncbi:hypothetical protein CARUB_v10003892mg [Capsella rubella]|uniref:F-box domain-containing protein n=1 Tax=Capsella rubella TaxID=81985 RepID=R0GS85_9BRAS|nr:hypothetical protein CARUB_v10003892mg [Capsella rubella]
MMKERKTKRRCVKRSGGAVFSSAREDLISTLPDALISQILLYLPTKEAVRTSVLSSRWKSVWLLIPKLDLDSKQFPDHNAFMGFMEKFIDISREHKSCLHKLKLRVHQNGSDQSCVTPWIDFVARRKLKHLDVECLSVKRDQYLEVIPLSLYICDTLVYLRIHGVSFGLFESISLPRLKTMCLEQNAYASEKVLESLISSCPVLEDLTIVRRTHDNVKVLRVHSQTLTCLSVGFDSGESDEAMHSYSKGETRLWIDAPRLKYLYLENEVSKSKVISNTGSLVKVSFVDSCSYPSDEFAVSKQQIVRDFFTAISRVKDVTFSKSIMKLIWAYLQVQPLPWFCNMSCLEAEFSRSDVNILSTFLERCPNLTSIVLDSISFSRLPQCLLSSLEIVEIKSRFTGRSVEIKVARYFVENSLVLKKLVVHLSDSMQKRSLVHLRDLLALPRPSNCQIVYVVDS